MGYILGYLKFFHCKEVAMLGFIYITELSLHIGVLVASTKEGVRSVCVGGVFFHFS